ncbi:MAG: beta-propeller domain-containing protein [Campylobacterota bacterium]|nr:beta-propeller domain-containing protein [Campylobacterota bacterium]
MRIFLLSLLFLNFLYAEVTIEFKQGWQLVGVPSELKDMSLFDNDNVEIIWGFDGESQSWKGYSPDSDLEQKMIEKEIPFLSQLEPWQAIWIFSKQTWSLHVKDSSVPTEVKNNAIMLYEGWNLIEIPQQSVVSDSFFGDALVWKYGTNSEWRVNDDSLDFPSIETISVSEGLWVKSKTTREIKVDEELSALHTFKTEASMLSYIRTMVKLNNYGYYYGPVVPVFMPETSGTPNDDFSGGATEDLKGATTTNLQEDGVDEGDILKNDGTHIFSVDNSAQKIIVTSFDKIASQEYKPLYEIDMKDKNIVEMYLENSRLSVISSKAYIYDKPTDFDIPPAVMNASSQRMIAPYYDITQEFILDIFDVSDISAITSLSSYTIDGNYNSSRLIDGKLFLISQFYPRVDYEYPKVYVETPCSNLDRNEIYGNCMGEMVCNEGEECKITQECSYGSDYEAWTKNECYQYDYDEKGAWKYDYDNPIVKSENLIPHITSDTEVASLVTPSKFYAPNKLDQRANITSISRFDTQSTLRDESISFIGNTHTYYASLNSLYLVSSQYPYYYDFSHSKMQEMIYKFSLGETMAYKGRGSVAGTVLNQFSMSEKDEYLRIATTIGNSWSNEGTNNSVFTLKERDEKLEIQGTLSGLGKEGETIKAVRFMGNRGFVVTFKQTDPLYTLDMSDPLNPTKVGELSIPGFSSYLHVIDENRVLSIGRDADATGRALALQVSLFDISDFANPQLANKIKIGDDSLHSSTRSEAEHNHKAFIYRASDMIFGFPFTDYSSGIYTESLGVYQVDGMNINKLHTLTTSTPNNWGNSARGLIFNDNDKVHAALFKGSNIMSDIVK